MHSLWVVVLSFGVLARAGREAFGDSLGSDSPKELDPTNEIHGKEKKDGMQGGGQAFVQVNTHEEKETKQGMQGGGQAFIQVNKHAVAAAWKWFPLDKRKGNDRDNIYKAVIENEKAVRTKGFLIDGPRDDTELEQWVKDRPPPNEVVLFRVGTKYYVVWDDSSQKESAALHLLASSMRKS